MNPLKLASKGMFSDDVKVLACRIDFYDMLAAALKECGGDPKVDLDLCDVCYWRKRAEKIRPCHYCGGEGVVDSGGSPPWDYHVLCPACKPNLR